jgi:resolvase-like protein
VRAVLYARVSTDEQAKSGYSIPDQLRTVRHHAKSNGFEISEELVDDGYSGADPHRPDTANVIETSSRILNRRVRTRGLPVHLRYAPLRSEKGSDRV